MKRFISILGIFHLLLLSSCGGIGPPESCGVGGTADETLFGQYFNSMKLIEKSGSTEGTHDEEMGQLFSTSDHLVVQVEVILATAITFCIEERVGGGKIAFNESHTANVGLNSFDLGTFKANSYVIRVIVDDKLARNFPFGTE